MTLVCASFTLFNLWKLVFPWSIQLRSFAKVVYTLLGLLLFLSSYNSSNQYWAKVVLWMLILIWISCSGLHLWWKGKILHWSWEETWWGKDEGAFQDLCNQFWLAWQLIYHCFPSTFSSWDSPFEYFHVFCSFYCLVAGYLIFLLSASKMVNWCIQNLLWRPTFI